VTEGDWAALLADTAALRMSVATLQAAVNDIGLLLLVLVAVAVAGWLALLLSFMRKGGG
jgi:hypothetical protein